MAYQVRFTVPERRLGNADVSFSAYENGHLIGELLVSKGAVEWRPRDLQHSYRLNWTNFDRVCRQAGRRRRLP